MYSVFGKLVANALRQNQRLETRKIVKLIANHDVLLELNHQMFVILIWKNAYLSTWWIYFWEAFAMTLPEEKSNICNFLSTLGFEFVECLPIQFAYPVYPDQGIDERIWGRCIQW